MVAGVIATYCIEKPSNVTPCSSHKAVSQSLTRALTTSFRSICFGSLLSALITTLHSIWDHQQILHQDRVSCISSKKSIQEHIVMIVAHANWDCLCWPQSSCFSCVKSVHPKESKRIASIKLVTKQSCSLWALFVKDPNFGELIYEAIVSKNAVCSLRCNSIITVFSNVVGWVNLYHWSDWTSCSVAPFGFNFWRDAQILGELFSIAVGPYSRILSIMTSTKMIANPLILLTNPIFFALVVHHALLLLS